jgi:uncharacterized membrane protein
MAVIDKTLNRARNLVGEVADSVVSAGNAVADRFVSRESGGGKPVTLTVARPRAEVEQLWRDPEALSQVLGTVAGVTITAPNRYRWKVSVPDGHINWDSKLVETADGLRFVGADKRSQDNTTTEVSVQLRDAPADLGTEVTLTLRLPAPKVILRGAAFKVLYRARALLQTGELPTLTPTPAARPGNR